MLIIRFSWILNQNVPEHVAKRYLVPPLRAIQSARASLAAFAFSAELRLARHWRSLEQDQYKFETENELPRRRALKYLIEFFFPTQRVRYWATLRIKAER